MTPCPTCGALPCDQVSQATEQVSDDAVRFADAAYAATGGGVDNRPLDQITETFSTAPKLDDAVDDFLAELDGWESAYPLSAFPEPDLKRAAELLKAGGMTLDAVSASNMRHVVSCIAPKARAALTAANQGATK